MPDDAACRSASCRHACLLDCFRSSANHPRRHLRHLPYTPRCPLFLPLKRSDKDSTLSKSESSRNGDKFASVSIDFKLHFEDDTNTKTQVDAHTHTYTRAHTRTHARTHARAHTHSFIQYLRDNTGHQVEKGARMLLFSHHDILNTQPDLVLQLEALMMPTQQQDLHLEDLGRELGDAISDEALMEQMAEFLWPDLGLYQRKREAGTLQRVYRRLVSYVLYEPVTEGHCPEGSAEGGRGGVGVETWDRGHGGMNLEGFLENMEAKQARLTLAEVPSLHLLHLLTSARTLALARMLARSHACTHADA